MSWEPEKWAEGQFGRCELGDARRTARAVKMAAAFAQGCQGTLPGSMAAWSDLKAAYRLLNTEEVTFERLLGPHREQTRQACRAGGEYVLIEDTTDLNLTRAQPIQGLGWTGNEEERGLLVHSTLAGQIERWTAEGEPVVKLLGLFEQQVWTRKHKARKKKETQAQRLSRGRESERWAACLGASGGPPEGTRWTYIGDRESDIFEVLQRCRAAHTDCLLRACRPRRAVGEEGDLLSLARGAAVRGVVKLKLRSRPGVRARTARLTLRSRQVTLRGPRRPGGRPEPETINVVAVVEEDPPRGVAGIEWILLTTWPVETLAQCVRVAKTYAQRWLIEEYHKALKTGVGMERTQLESAQGVEALLGLLSVVAFRLLRLKLVGRAEPQRAVAAEDLTPAALRVLQRQFGKPAGGWTYAAVTRCIARLGGFLARKGDGDPGWLTLWRGSRRLNAMLAGYAIACEAQKCG